MALFASNPDRKILLETQLKSSWSVVVPNAAGRGEHFLEVVELAIKQFELVETTIERKELQTQKTDLKTANGIRACLFVHSKIVPIHQYETFFAVQDYGKHLILSQYIAGNVTGVRSALEKELLTSYFSLINEARETAVEVLGKELNQNISKINAQGKGLIDIV